MHAVWANMCTTYKVYRLLQLEKLYGNSATVAFYCRLSRFVLHLIHNQPIYTSISMPQSLLRFPQFYYCLLFEFGSIAMVITHCVRDHASVPTYLATWIYRSHKTSVFVSGSSRLLQFMEIHFWQFCPNNNILCAKKVPERNKSELRCFPFETRECKMKIKSICLIHGFGIIRLTKLLECVPDTMTQQRICELKQLFLHTKKNCMPRGRGIRNILQTQAARAAPWNCHCTMSLIWNENRAGINTTTTILLSLRILYLQYMDGRTDGWM